MQTLLNKQRAFFKENRTKSYEFRMRQLETLRKVIFDNQVNIEKALKQDLNKSSFEAYVTEIGICLHSLRQARKNLKKWMKVKKVRTPYYFFLTKSYIRHDPRGNVLIIAPFNYPFQLVIEPLIGAIAAGNTAVIKPSEFTSHTESVIQELINRNFPEEFIHVVTGDKETTSELLRLQFDYIFFTGSTQVGRIVYEAASKNLTPVTLELGGKSPAIVDETADIEVAARRVAFGKFINAGQTCIAPDYVFVQSSVKDRFIHALVTAISTFYHDPGKDYARIVNEKHFKRLIGLIDEEKVIYGNNVNEKERYISPTVLDRITLDDPVMGEEIFGPLLPVLTYETIDEVIDTLQEKDSPLALYLFTTDKHMEEKIFNSLSFGGGAVNDTLMQVANPHLPFGGVGASGTGVYHGKYSFETFSHKKAYVKKSTRFDPSLVYPPYSNLKEKFIRRLLK